MSWIFYPQWILALWAPLASYALWRAVWPRLAGDARARYRVTWWLCLLPLLVWLVPYWPNSPLRRLPYLVPIVWGAYRSPPRQLWLSMPLLLYDLPVHAFFTGSLIALVRGTLAQRAAAHKIRRLPQYQAGHVRVLAVPGFIAFTFGLFRPRIYLSEAAWRSPYRQAILAHEREHARRRHPLSLFIARGIRQGVAWHLPCWARVLHHLEFEAERVCDERACREVGRAAYAQALLAATEERNPSLALGQAVALFARPAEQPDLLDRARSLAQPPSSRLPALFWPALALAYMLIVVLL